MTTKELDALIMKLEVRSENLRSDVRCLRELNKAKVDPKVVLGRMKRDAEKLIAMLNEVI